MKNGKLLQFALAVLVFTVINCNNGVSPDKGDGKLFNTKWKLVGFFDVEKEMLATPEVNDCENCYTLEFSGQKDTLFLYDSGYWRCSGEIITLNFGCSYAVDYTSSTFNFGAITRVAAQELHDGEEYNMMLYNVQAFELSNDSLKLYYNDRKNYLLFKRRQ